MDNNCINLGVYCEPGEEAKPVSIKIDEIGKKCYSMLVLGRTRKGKTYKIIELLKDLVKFNATIIVIDIHGTMSKEQIPAELSDDFEANANRFDGYVNSIPCHLMDALVYRDGVKERPYDTAAFLTEVLSGIYHFDVRQTPTCRKAFKDVIKKDSYKAEGFKAVGRSLDAIGDEVAQNVKDKIESLIDHNAFIDGELPLEQGRINVFDLSRYDTDSQSIIAELLLHYLYRRRRAGLDSPFFICLDEFQNIGMDKRGILSKILAEGSKYGVNAILLTQSLKIYFNTAQIKLLMQTAYKLFFEPSEADAKEFASIIDPKAVTDTICNLKNLKLGEFMLTGPKYVGSLEETDPITVRPAGNALAASNEPDGLYTYEGFTDDMTGIEVPETEPVSGEEPSKAENTVLPGEKHKAGKSIIFKKECPSASKSA